MTSEQKALCGALLRFLAVIIFASLYCLGGMGHLYLRRYVAPVELVITLLIFSRFDWRSLSALVGIGSLCLGYSADATWVKILKRALFGLANGTAFSLPNLLNKRFLLGITQIVLVPTTCIIFGVWNPFPDARVEELVIGVEISLIPIMSCKPR